MTAAEKAAAARRHVASYRESQRLVREQVDAMTHDWYGCTAAGDAEQAAEWDARIKRGDALLVHLDWRIRELSAYAQRMPAA